MYESQPERTPASRETRRSARLSRSQNLEEELRDLEIDGYQVVFTRKVALMPAELTHLETVVPSKS